MMPGFSKAPPFEFLKIFGSFNFEFKFSSSQELPDNFKKALFSWHHGFAPPISSNDPQSKIDLKLKDYIEPGMEIHAILENGLAFSIETRLPGWGRHFCRNYKV